MSKKKIAFMHQTYPAQFGPVSEFIAREHNAEVAFFTEHVSKPIHASIKHFRYKPVVSRRKDDPYFFSKYFEQEVSSMHGVYDTLQRSGFNPDALVGHVAFGNMGLLHLDYQDIPRIGFFELFYDPYGKHSESRPEYPAPKPNRMRIPMRNATQLVELEYCSKGYSPTRFQKSTYPSVYQDKLSVLFDGIDVEFYSPGEVSPTSDLKRSWPKDAKLVTYVSRGLEAMRGFDIFMEVAHKVSLERDDVHFIIAGNPKTNYGSEMIGINETSFKEYVLKKRNYDLSKFHFLEWVSESALRDLFRISDCHFYWTVPFTLSWSLLQSMSTGCLVVASDTAPVRDAIENDRNGILVSPYEVEQFSEVILDALSNASRFKPHRQCARQTAIDHFSFDKCLPLLANFLLNDTVVDPKRVIRVAETAIV